MEKSNFSKNNIKIPKIDLFTGNGGICGYLWGKTLLKISHRFESRSEFPLEVISGKVW